MRLLRRGAADRTRQSPLSSHDVVWSTRSRADRRSSVSVMNAVNGPRSLAILSGAEPTGRPHNSHSRDHQINGHQLGNYRAHMNPQRGARCVITPCDGRTLWNRTETKRLARPQSRHNSHRPYLDCCLSFSDDQFPSNYEVGDSAQNAQPSRGTFDPSPFLPDSHGC